MSVAEARIRVGFIDCSDRAVLRMCAGWTGSDGYSSVVSSLAVLVSVGHRATPPAGAWRESGSLAPVGSKHAPTSTEDRPALRPVEVGTLAGHRCRRQIRAIAARSSDHGSGKAAPWRRSRDARDVDHRNAKAADPARCLDSAAHAHVRVAQLGSARAHVAERQREPVSTRARLELDVARRASGEGGRREEQLDDVVIPESVEETRRAWRNTRWLEQSKLPREDEIGPSDLEASGTAEPGGRGRAVPLPVETEDPQDQ